MINRQTLRRNSTRRRHAQGALALGHLQMRAGHDGADLQALCELNPTPLWICDRHSLQFLAVNDAALRLYGYPRPCFLNHSPRDLHADPKSCADDLAAAARCGAALPRQHRNVTGATIDVELTVQPLSYGGREAYVCAVRDVTAQRRAIRAMEASERRFRDLFEFGVGLVCTHDMDGMLLSVNPAAAAALGYRIADMIGRSLGEFVHADLQPFFADYLRRVVHSGDDAGLLSVTHRDGRQLIWKYRNRVLRDATGEPFVMGHAEDITERRHYEHRLEEQQAELEAVTDGSPIGLFRADLDGRLLYVNRTFERIAGQRADEAMGAGWARALHPEDRERVLALWGAAVQARSAFQSTHRFRPDPATTVWASMRAQPLIVKGEVAGYVGSIADVTARHVAEQQLARNEQRLRTIADAVPAMIAYVDSALRFVFVNAAYARWHGREPAELIGRSGPELIGPELYAKRKPYLDRALAGERVMFEEERQMGDEYRCFEITYIPQHDEETGEVLGLHVMFQDITRKALQERGWMRAAEIDNLTGVANRAGFIARLERALTRGRDQQSMLAVMYLDIDHFKQINDTYGHGVGDAVIQAFAQRLSSILRPSDVIGRLGGDEFCVVLEAVRRPQYASVVAAKIVSAMRRPFVLQHEKLTLSLSTSVGLALSLEEPELSAGALLKRADGALYQAKAAGRDAYKLAQESRRVDPSCAVAREETVEMLTP